MKKEIAKLIVEIEDGHHHNAFGWVAVGFLLIGVIPRAIALIPEYICNYIAMCIIDLEEWFQNKKNNKKK